MVQYGEVLHGTVRYNNPLLVPQMGSLGCHGSVDTSPQGQPVLCSLLSPPVMRSSIAELSEHFCRKQLMEWYEKSEVLMVKRNGASTVSCRAPVLQMILSDTQPHILWSVCEVVQNPRWWSTPINSSLSLRIVGWFVLKALEKSKKVIVTVRPHVSMWQREQMCEEKLAN